LLGIYAAVTRQDPEGNPPGGWKPEERVSIYQAIRMFTKNIPLASREQEWLGTIEAGKFADFVVLDQDPFQIPADKLKDICALRTFVGGEQVFFLEEGR
jgi:Predicted metal-dependent hydrolase with the TIM-barrel fold